MEISDERLKQWTVRDRKDICYRVANGHEDCDCRLCTEWLMARELLELRKADRTMEARIETLLGVTCSRCEKGDALFVEPDTGFYTHTLGGNYCSAHKLHSALNTKQSQAARSKVPASPEAIDRRAKEQG